MIPFLFKGRGRDPSTALPLFTVDQISAASATVGFAYTKTVYASIADSSLLTFSLEAGPAGAALTDHEDGSATVSWTPSETGTGSFSVSVGDQYGRTLYTDWVVTATGSQVEQDLSMRIASIEPSIDLSPSFDWVHWGETVASTVNRKTGDPGLIGTMASIGGATWLRYIGDPARQTISWTDGTPAATATNSRNGIYLSTTNDGFRITAEGTGEPRELIIYAGGWQTTATMTATLSNGDLTESVPLSWSGASGTDSIVAIAYTAAITDTLTVDFRKTGTTGNISLRAAALYQNVGLEWSEPLSFTVYEPLSSTLTVSDAAATAALVALNVPGTATFTDHGDQTATLTWTPAPGDVAGSPYAMIVQVVDGGQVLRSSQYAVAVAEATANPPVLSFSAALEFEVDGTDTVTVSATGDTPIAITATGLPDTATLVDQGDSTAILAWSPSTTAIVPPITITATDQAGRTTTQSATMTAVIGGADPVTLTVEAATVTAGTPVNLTTGVEG